MTKIERESLIGKIKKFFSDKASDEKPLSTRIVPSGGAFDTNLADIVMFSKNIPNEDDPKRKEKL